MAQGDLQYTIQPGDTLSQIASVYTIGGTAYGPALANYNSLANPNLIQVGSTLNIPQNWLRDVWKTGSPGLTQQPGITIDITGGTPAKPSCGYIGCEDYKYMGQPSTAIKPNYLMWVLMGGSALLLLTVIVGRSGKKRRK